MIKGWLHLKALPHCLCILDIPPFPVCLQQQILIKIYNQVATQSGSYSYILQAVRSQPNNLSHVPWFGQNQIIVGDSHLIGEVGPACRPCFELQVLNRIIPYRKLSSFLGTLILKLMNVSASVGIYTHIQEYTSKTSKVLKQLPSSIYHLINIIQAVRECREPLHLKCVYVYLCTNCCRFFVHDDSHPYTSYLEKNFQNISLSFFGRARL